MPENRMGHIAEEQKELYAKARDKLRILLKEQLLAKLPKPPAEENNKSAPSNTPAEENKKTPEIEQSPPIPPQAAGERTDKPLESELSPPNTPENAADKPTRKPSSLSCKLRQPPANHQDKPLEPQQSNPNAPEATAQQTVKPARNRAASRENSAKRRRGNQ